MVVLTIKQLERLTKEELIDDLLTVNSIHEDIANLTSRWIPWKICTSGIWTCSFKNLYETSLQTNRNITKKHFGLFAIPWERNNRDKSSTWRYPKHAAGRINMPSFIPHWYSCFHWWSWSLSQNETKRLGKSQVLHQKKKEMMLFLKRKV